MALNLHFNKMIITLLIFLLNLWQMSKSTGTLVWFCITFTPLKWILHLSSLFLYHIYMWIGKYSFIYWNFSVWVLFSHFPTIVFISSVTIEIQIVDDLDRGEGLKVVAQAVGGAGFELSYSNVWTCIMPTHRLLVYFDNLIIFTFLFYTSNYNCYSECIGLHHFCQEDRLEKL